MLHVGTLALRLQIFIAPLSRAQKGGEHAYSPEGTCTVLLLGSIYHRNHHRVCRLATSRRKIRVSEQRVNCVVHSNIRRDSGGLVRTSLCYTIIG